MAKPRLLSDEEVEEIRAGIRDGMRGPIVTTWIERLLADRDERIRLEGEQQR